MIWVILSVCVLVSFLFSGIEAGLLSLNPVRLAHFTRQGEPTARKLSALVAHPERLLVSVLLMTNATNIIALVVVTRLLVDAMGRWGYLVALLVLAPGFLLLLELLPKSLFRRFPYRLLAVFADVMRVSYTLLLPISWLAVRMAQFMFPGKMHPSRNLLLAREHVKFVAAESERQGELTRIESRLIHGVIDYRNVKAADVMLPMERVVHAQPRMPVAEAVRLARRNRLDRLPVVNESGKVVGLVDVLDLLIDGRSEQPVERHLRRTIHARKKEPAYNLLRRLRASGIAVAVIVDENKTPQGIAARDDLARRLVAGAGEEAVLEKE